MRCVQGNKREGVDIYLDAGRAANGKHGQEEAAGATAVYSGMNVEP